MFMGERKSCGYLNIYQLCKVIKFSYFLRYFFLSLGCSKVLKMFMFAEFPFYLHVNRKTISDVSEKNPFLLVTDVTNSCDLCKTVTSEFVRKNIYLAWC